MAQETKKHPKKAAPAPKEKKLPFPGARPPFKSKPKK